MAVFITAMVRSVPVLLRILSFACLNTAKGSAVAGIKEKDRQELLRAADSSDPYARATIERVFDDANNLIDGDSCAPPHSVSAAFTPTLSRRTMPGTAVFSAAAS